MYHPGETNLRRADVIVINKMETADAEAIEIVRENIRQFNPNAIVVDGASPLFIDKPLLLKGKRALVVEDGPTLTHGGMQYGAGFVAAQKFGASEIVDPRPFVVGEIEQTFKKYPGIGTILPAMGYGKKQIRDLEKTISRAKVDVVVIATPIDLGRIIKIKKPHVRVSYELQEIGYPSLKDVLKDKKFI
jgi:predicted GTPase